MASKELENDIRKMLQDPQYAPLTQKQKAEIFNNALAASMNPDKHPPYSKKYIEALERFRKENPIDRDWGLQFSGKRRSRNRRSRRRRSRNRRSRNRRSRKRRSRKRRSRKSSKRR
jgi:hypothetical protein